ncbi:hypothetical protein PSI19_11695 [Xenorhabdus khoisanae]|uniref:hypothetical protein n=1 Tax=Xenorhabdus khoisanae TaxID=880157 RepID=UPI00235A14C6|nr:hypothetical protein [Xenorhabdus khoisanae]MDC9614520.1 hypothetical protein [Xenorhabdus khoisanae]
MNPRTKAEQEILAGTPVSAVVYIWYPCHKFFAGHASIYIGGVPKCPWPNDFPYSTTPANPMLANPIPENNERQPTSPNERRNSASPTPYSVTERDWPSTSSNNPRRPTDDNYVSFLADPNIPRGILSCAGVFNNLREDFVVSPHLEYYLVGLDVVKMQHEKSKIYNGKMYGNFQMSHSYNPINKNCSTMVAKILKAGGVESLLTPNCSMNQYRTPKDIAQLCNKLRNRGMAAKVRELDCPGKLETPFRTLLGFR